MKSVSYEVWDQACAIYPGRYMAWIQTHNQIWIQVENQVRDHIRRDHIRFQVLGQVEDQP